MGYNSRMHTEVTLRPARPADAPQAAPLIYAAGPTLYTLMFGPDRTDVLRLFEELFALPRNPFSYQRGLLAIRGDEVVGLALAAPVGSQRGTGAGLRMLYLLPRLRGFWPLLRNGRAMRDIGACVSTPPRDAYYLGILAVAAEARCHGVGSALIEEVHHRARLHGASCIALHAELDNAVALRFYDSHGYTEAHRHPSLPRLARQGIAGLAALHRPLP